MISGLLSEEEMENEGGAEDEEETKGESFMREKKSLVAEQEGLVGVWVISSEEEEEITKDNRRTVEEGVRAGAPSGTGTLWREEELDSESIVKEGGRELVCCRSSFSLVWMDVEK
jgi:hypothetical protein